VISELGLPLTAAGVVVTDATDYAARIGLTPGDIITTINGTDIAYPADVTSAAQEDTRRWEVDILRQGQPLRLRFRI
jgi:S1-C subfamily serine protease